MINFHIKLLIYNKYGSKTNILIATIYFKYNYTSIFIILYLTSIPYSTK